MSTEVQPTGEPACRESRILVEQVRDPKVREGVRKLGVLASFTKNDLAVALLHKLVPLAARPSGMAVWVAANPDVAHGMSRQTAMMAESIFRDCICGDEWDELLQAHAAAVVASKFRSA